MRAVLLENLRFAVGDYLKNKLPTDENYCGNEELKLTVLLSWLEGKPDIFCHISKLPSLPTPPVKVEIRGHPRHNALAKDSKWVSERKPLEELMGKDVNELILKGGDGSLLEGSQTNFYVISNGTLCTAGEGILEGTVRHLVLKVCKDNDIPVSFDTPNLKDIDKWEGLYTHMIDFTIKNLFL